MNPNPPEIPFPIFDEHACEVLPPGETPAELKEKAHKKGPLLFTFVARVGIYIPSDTFPVSLRGLGYVIVSPCDGLSDLRGAIKAGLLIRGKTVCGELVFIILPGPLGTYPPNPSQNEFVKRHASA